MVVLCLQRRLKVRGNLRQNDPQYSKDTGGTPAHERLKKGIVLWRELAGRTPALLSRARRESFWCAKRGAVGVRKWPRLLSGSSSHALPRLCRCPGAG